MQGRAAKLYQRAIFFYKMAAQLNLPFQEDVFKTQPGRKEADYHQWLSQLSTINAKEILIGMDYFWDDPYFNFKLVFDALMHNLFSFTKRLPSVFTALEGTLDPWKTKRLKTETIKYYLDHFADEMGTDYYMNYIETDNDLSNEYLRKAQLSLVNWIYENASQYFDSTVKLLTTLLKESKKFNKDFLLRLAKHLGPEFYAEVVSQYYPFKAQETNTYRPLSDRDVELLKKETLNIYDIAEWLELQNKKHLLIHKGEFEKILIKVNNDAKDYLRKFLYRSDDGQFFILDEEMRPMNKNYQSIQFPTKFQVFRDWQSIEPLRDAWRPIFEEFHIIPVNYDHWD